MDQNRKWNQREIIYSTICSVPGRNSGCVSWFLYQGITQWHYIFLIIRLLQKQEKTPEFESVCDKAEIWGFSFLVWLHSYLFGTIRLSQTSCLKAWDTIERTTEGTQEDRINGRRYIFIFSRNRTQVPIIPSAYVWTDTWAVSRTIFKSLLTLWCLQGYLQTCCWLRTLVSRRFPVWGSPCGRRETEVTSMQRAGVWTQRLATWDLAFFPELKLVPVHLLAQHSRKAIFQEAKPEGTKNTVMCSRVTHSGFLLQHVTFRPPNERMEWTAS